MEKKVAIFVDGSNFYHGLKDNKLSTRIAFQKLGKKLCLGYGELLRIYYYNAPIDQTKNPGQYKDQQRFFESLYRTPFLEVRLGRLVPKADTYIEKGIDVYIAVDMLQMAYENRYDVGILVSGDGDLAEAVKVVKNLGKHVINACFDSCRSQHLLQVCDAYIRFDRDFLSDCY
jgi:uncharacterized LabA/DUF88 family protein